MSTFIYQTTKTAFKNIYLNALNSKLDTLEIRFESENLEYSFKYGFSFDDVSYSEWYDSHEEMIVTINNTEISYASLYVRIQVEVQKTVQAYGCFTIYEILANNETVPVSIETVKQVDNILRTVHNENLYNPYKRMDAAHELNKKLAYSVSKIFAHQCTYFRTEPDEDTKSVVFKSYRLSNVVEVKSMELLINDNELPDNRTNFSEWDYDFFDQLECHIVVQVFNEIFPNSIPNSNDYLYLPLTDRIYQINTVNEVKKFMHKSTYYQLILTKWDDRANVNDILPNNESALDALPDVQYADEFGFEDVQEEYEDATKTYNDEEESNNVTVDETVSNGMTIMRYMFDYTDESNDIVTQSYEFVAENEFSAMSWFKLSKSSISLFDIVDTNNTVIFDVSSVNDMLNVEYIKDGYRVLMSTAGSKLVANTKYCLILNYVYNEKGKYLTLAVVNDKFEVVQQNFTKVFDKTLSTSKINFKGGYTYGNIRVKRSIVSNSDIQKVLLDQLPEAKDYYVLRNATPSIKTEKYKY